jgi:hypothetical protein
MDAVQEIRGLIEGRETTISEDIALGPRFTLFQSAQAILAQTQKRHALRALLLCQRVFFSDLAPSLISTSAPCNRLPQNWKEQSLNFWKNRSEMEIRQALRMFVSTSHNIDLIANAALAGKPSWPESYLTTTRENFTGKPVSTCYQAVMVWLFKSGFASLQWLLKCRTANTKDTLTAAFGVGRVIWQGSFADNQTLPAIPRGHIVHIFQDPASWNGHWMLSIGNGQAAGCNNNDENPMVQRDYCSQLTIHKQFLAYGGGTAVVIDPAQIPGRS